jgi:hypothetical protein
MKALNITPSARTTLLRNKGGDFMRLTANAVTVLSPATTPGYWQYVLPDEAARELAKISWDLCGLTSASVP